MLVHVIQRRRYISHQAHEKERHLEYGIGDKVQTAHQLIIPCRRLEVDEERGNP